MDVFRFLHGTELCPGGDPTTYDHGLDDARPRVWNAYRFSLDLTVQEQYSIFQLAFDNHKRRKVNSASAWPLPIEMDCMQEQNYWKKMSSEEAPWGIASSEKCAEAGEKKKIYLAPRAEQETTNYETSKTLTDCTNAKSTHSKKTTKPKNENYQKLNALFSKGRRWTAQEDKILCKAVKKHDYQNWKAIASEIPGRDHIQCLQRWNTRIRPGLKKGAWQPDEDKILIEMVKKSGTGSWSAIAKAITGRTPKQCRERWNLTLDPTINKSPWTEEEEALLLKKYDEVGSSWAFMRQFFIGRTENAIKSRCKALLRNRERDKTIVWTSELISQLESIVKTYHYDIRLIQKHLPCRLKGISPSILRYHCSRIRQNLNTMISDSKNDTGKGEK